MDVSGKTIHTSETRNEFCDIFLNDTPKGVYIAQIITGSRIVYVKFVL